MELRPQSQRRHLGKSACMREPHTWRTAPCMRHPTESQVQGVSASPTSLAFNQSGDDMRSAVVATHDGRRQRICQTLITVILLDTDSYLVIYSPCVVIRSST